MLELAQVVSDFAAAFKAVDTNAPRGRSRVREYRPGIGPLTENESVTNATEWLGANKGNAYQGAGPKTYPGSRQICDLVIPGLWAIEFKLLRPFGDNGVEAEHWSENILHPYPGNVSSIGDALKLSASAFAERKAIIVFGYEHIPPLVNLDTAIECFEVICTRILNIRLSKRCYSEFSDLIHPYHRHGKLYGWEVQQGRTGG